MGDSVLGGRYRLREALGGTMAQVFLAEDTELGRDVVVKLLGPDAERARFEREARAAATLTHDNIVRIYAYGEAEDGRPYMIFEHLPGGTLEDRLGAGALPDAETLRIARDVAAGLAHAHAHGLVHRDLKPANILFDAEERAKISDFGIARLGGAGTLTEAGTVLGTAAYISPEQAAGERATPASDVYSFGVVLFQMLTGRLPFDAQEPAELVRLHRTEPPPNVSELRADVPARTESLVATMLAKDPRDRPANGAALLAELDTPASEDHPTAVLAAPRRAAGAPQRLRIGIAATVLALLAAGGVTLALVATDSSSRTTSTSQAVSTHRARTQTAPTTTEAASTAASTAATTTQQTTAPATTRPQTTQPVTTEPTTETVPTEETLPTTVVSTAITLPDG